MLVRVSKLPDSKLKIGETFETTEVPGLAEVNDIAVADDRVYFTAGSFITSENHTGIQYIDLNTNAINEFIPVTGGTKIKSIVVQTIGSENRIVFTNGFSGEACAIEMRRTDKSLVKRFRNSSSGDLSTLEKSYLQVDSKGRIYAMPSHSFLIRFDPGLERPEIFRFDDVEIAYQTRFVVREKDNKIEVIFVKYRAK